MNRLLTIFNFLGICALIVLCCLQWTDNRRVHLRLTVLQAKSDQQADMIAQQAQTIRGNTADLDEFRHRLSRSQANLSETEARLAVMTAQRDQVQATNQRLQLTLSKWIAAVTARDALIKQASTEIEQLAHQRNGAILRFNALAVRYNAIVKQIAVRNTE